MSTNHSSQPTLEAVREAIGNAGVFYVAQNFDLWVDFCGGSVSILSSIIAGCMVHFCLSARKACEVQYLDINKANCLARAQQLSTSIAQCCGSCFWERQGRESAACIRSENN